MRKKALTLAEIMIAMSMMGVLAVIAAKTISTSMPNEVILKYKHIYAAVTTAVKNIVENPVLYPTSDLSDINNATYFNTGKTYTGNKKFYLSFMEQFNVLSSQTSQYNLPLYVLSGQTTNAGGKAQCFTENRGVTFCMQKEFPSNLDSFFITIYMESAEKFSETSNQQYYSAAFVQVSKDGNISMPVKVVASGQTLVDCSLAGRTYSNHLQCVLLQGMNNQDI